MSDSRWEDDHLLGAWQAIGTEPPDAPSILRAVQRAQRREHLLSLAELLMLTGLIVAGAWGLLEGPAVTDLWWAAAWIAVLVLASTVSLLSASRDPRPLLATTARFIGVRRLSTERRERWLRRGFRLLALQSVFLAPLAISRLLASPEASLSHHGLGSLVSSAVLLTGSLLWTGNRLAVTRRESARLSAIEADYGSEPDPDQTIG